MNSITNKNRYILIFKGVALCVVCAYAFVLFVSPFLNVEAQGVTSGLMKISGSDDVYLWYAFDGKKYKRLIHRNAISLYSWLNGTTVETVNQNEFDSYTTVEVATHYPQGRGAVDEQGLQVPPELWRIRNDNGILTIKRLYMSVPSAIISGYEHFNIFEIKEQEIELYSQGDPIYFTGTDSWESNVYRKQDALQEDERGTRIYDTIIPQGENRCTIQGDVVAVVGKPGVNYVAVTEDATPDDLGTVQGGNVTVYIQASDLDNQTPSFTLECQQESPLNVHTIDTSTLPEPEITFTHSGTGEQTFEMTLPSGFHYCGLQDSDGNEISQNDSNLRVRIQNASSIHSLFIGGKTYNVSVKRQKAHIPPYEGTWTVQCHTPQTITLQPNILTRITGTGYPTSFRLGWTSDTKYIVCTLNTAERLFGLSFDFASHNTPLRIISGLPVIEIGTDPYRDHNNTFLDIAIGLFPAIGLFSSNPQWTVFCRSQDTVPPGQQDINLTPFITGPKVEPHPTNKNPNLLRNVVAKADGINCANHLLGVEDVIADILLVPENLCIHYTTINRPGIAGGYSDTSNTIRIKTSPLTVDDEDAFNDMKEIRDKTLIHELCHAQQDYYANEINFGSRTWNHLVPEFVKITGHEWNPSHPESTFGWFYPDTGKYYEMYGTGIGAYWNKYDVLEAGAEFCVAFASLNAGRDDIARRIRGGADERLRTMHEDNKAREWVEGYMLNPNLEPYTSVDLSSIIPTDIQVTNIQRPTADSISFDVSWNLPSGDIPLLTEEQRLTLDYDITITSQNTIPGGKRAQISITNKQINSRTVTIQAAILEVQDRGWFRIAITPSLGLAYPLQEYSAQFLIGKSALDDEFSFELL